LLGRVRDAAILALAAGALSLEIWTVVPPPTMPILAVTVLLPECAPFAAVACAGIAFAAFRWTRGRVRTAALVASGVALGCALAPLVELPSAVAAAERELGAGGWGGDAGALRPFDLAVLVRGYQTPTGVTVRRNLPVVTKDGARLALDLYRSAIPGSRPTLIVIYGGAWMFGNRDDSAELASAFAARGYTVAAIDYRHAPAHRFPTQPGDVRAAMETLARHALAWGIDRNRVAILGSSSGAELALLAAYEPGPLTIRAVVGYYAPTDLVDGYLRPPQPDPADVRSILKSYLGGTPHERAGDYREASPITHVREGLPPTLLIVGTRDELVPPRFQRAMRDTLRARGVPVAAIEIPWSNHAFDAIPNGLGGQIARSATDRFLRATLAAAI
jgi:acetyl esterase/lipase